VSSSDGFAISAKGRRPRADDHVDLLAEEVVEPRRQQRLGHGDGQELDEEHGQDEDVGLGLGVDGTPLARRLHMPGRLRRRAHR
jgi:hypothetical protein